mmetsp:Transcript_23265/g.39776  ORF Transcript_23265/g.39776 Transcript_23265/m.39776 type:complete len:82 (-) Transcript_23265:77-322(-)
MAVGQRNSNAVGGYNNNNGEIMQKNNGNGNGGNNVDDEQQNNEEGGKIMDLSNLMGASNGTRHRIGLFFLLLLIGLFAFLS